MVFLSPTLSFNTQKPWKLTITMKEVALQHVQTFRIFLSPVDERPPPPTDYFSYLLLDKNIQQKKPQSNT